MVCPKTMDNDVRNTEYCIGFSTAITRATDAIERQRTTVGSHERVGIFRVFGRDAGTPRPLHRVCEFQRPLLHSGVQGGPGEVIDLVISDKRSNPSNYSLVVLSEGAEWEGLQGERVRRCRRLRPSQEGERGGGSERRDQAPHAARKPWSAT